MGSEAKVIRRFSADGLDIYLKIEGRDEKEVTTLYRRLVREITHSMEDVMNRVATERLDKLNK